MGGWVQTLAKTFPKINFFWTASLIPLKDWTNWFPPQTGDGQAAPRPESSLRGGQGRLRQGGLALGGGWGLAGLADLEPQTTDKVVNVKGSGLDKAVQHILR